MHENNERLSDDFVSLDTFKTAILDFLRVIFNLFDFIFSSVKMNMVLLTLSTLLGILVAFLVYEIKPKYFASEMIVISNTLGRKEYYGIVNNLNNQLVSLNYPEISKSLNIRIEEAKNITFLEVDTSGLLGQPFIIQAKLSNRNLPDSLDEKLVKYLNNGSPYLKQVQEGELRIATDRLAFIEQEQQRLDSLKVLYNRTLGKLQSPSTFYNNAINPAEIYGHSNSLAYQKDSILHWINSRSKPVMLIDAFKQPTTPNKFSLKAMLLLGLAGGIILGIIIILLTTIRRMLRARGAN